ncbi:hypothetical protein CFP56_018690 [Quercus suber]|uniref:Maturase K n=1 Tax=Quercus suber TaxID=58331 RepID=A0AAW0KJD9_QUESU
MKLKSLLSCFLHHQSKAIRNFEQRLDIYKHNS